MNNKGRILVVEDLPESRRTFARSLKMAGYDADTAGDLEEALRKLQEKTYHVAVVDLSLDPDDPTNRDGVEVVRRVHELAEGTRCIILSSHRDLEIAIEGYEKLGLLTYIMKGEPQPGGDLVSTVDDARQKVKLREAGRLDSVISVFAGEDRDVWIDLALRTLNPSGGLRGLDSFISTLCNQFTPLHPRRPGKPAEIDLDRKCVRGEFWSKQRGEGVGVFIYPDSSEATCRGTLVRGREEDHLQEHKKAGLIGFVFRLPNSKRDEFVERI